MRIVRAVQSDAAVLTAIAHAAKRHWGYPDDWIQHWRPALTLTRDYIDKHPTMIAVEDEHRVGFCSVVVQSNTALLDHLWVLPHAMKRGVGRLLFSTAEDIAHAAGATRLTIVGDPHAEGFYLRMGAHGIGREPAPLDGVNRYLPLLEKALR
jgi:GNAT superfamily N-acetyltransferase